MTKASSSDKRNEKDTEDVTEALPASMSDKGFFGGSKHTKIISDIGPILKKARIESKRSLKEIAAKLHIKEEYLNAIERDDYDNLPSNTFVVGYVKSYSKLLGINTQKLLDTLALTLKKRHEDHFLEMTAVEPTSYKESWLMWGGAFLLATFTLISLFLWLDDNAEVESEISDVSELLEEVPSEEALDERGDASGITPLPVTSESVERGVIEKNTQSIDSEQVVSKAQGLNIKSAKTYSYENKIAELNASNAKEPEINKALVFSEAGFGMPSYVRASEKQMDDVKKGLSMKKDNKSDTLWVQFDRECWIEITDEMGDIVYTDLHYGNSELELRAAGPLSILLGDASAVRNIIYNDKALALDSDKVLGRQRRLNQKVARVNVR